MATRKELDEIFSSIDNLLCSGKFEEVNTVYETLDPCTMDLDILTCYAMVAFPARDKLLAHKEYVKKAVSYLETTYPEKEKGLIQYLRNAM